MDEKWYVYILECADGSLYTGITTNLERRLAAHNMGKGAKYTKSRRPVRLCYREEGFTHSQALKRELEIKAMERKEKQSLMKATEKASV